jgi:hypothetical protein
LHKPKVYKKDGLETFRLVGSDGSEFFYEGAIDCDEKEVYRDDQGRPYYPVTAEPGSPLQYFVELEEKAEDLPVSGAGEKEIAHLIAVSPRTAPELPADPPATPEAPPETSPRAEPAVDSPPAEQSPAPGTAPEPAAAPEPQPADKQEPADTARTEPGGTAAAGSPQPAEAARPPVPPAGKGPEKRSLALPIALVLIVVVVAALAAIYIVKPGAFDGLGSLFPGAAPSPTPGPEPAATAAPTPEPAATPEPTPEPGSVEELARMHELIDYESPAIEDFVTRRMGSGTLLRQSCNLFSYVNGVWNNSGSREPGLASEIAASPGGSSKDYSVLVCALMKALGYDSRIVAAYEDDLVYYYPEIMVSKTTSGYYSAREDLKAWYGIDTAYGHSDDDGYWLSLAMGDAPGRALDPNMEYAVYPTGEAPKILR